MIEIRELKAEMEAEAKERMLAGKKKDPVTKLSQGIDLKESKKSRDAMEAEAKNQVYSNPTKSGF